MCTHYVTPDEAAIERYWSYVRPPTFEYRPDMWPGYKGPILIEGFEWRPAVFGLIPFFSKDGKDFRRTYNARSETVAEKPSYRGPWKRGQRCLVPMSAFFEPNYESGKPVQWRIERRDGELFTAAGIWDIWKPKDASEGDPPTWSFSMLTINADRHPLMRRMHAPGDEKRSIVIIPPDRREEWLNEGVPLEPFPADEYRTEADPLPPRKKAAGS